MRAAFRRPREAVDIWPGWVDALSTLLIIIIFVLLVFVLGQFFLGQALSGREQALSALNRRMAELTETLSLERTTWAELEGNLSRLSDQLRGANQELGVLAQLRIDMRDLEGRFAEKTTEATQLKSSLDEAAQKIAADRDTLAQQAAQLALVQNQVKALEALKADLEKQVAALGAKVATSDTAIAEERRLSAEAQAQAALMSQQLQEMQQELARLSATLDASDKLSAEQKAQISDLGRRMNRALAGKVQELQRYRSEFFGRLRDILGARPGISVVGDRFVFQSEVLFASGSAELGVEGQRQLAQLAQTLLGLARQFPADINWILRVDGHTDTVPITTALFPSNWELSTARAVSVVKFLAAQGIPADRLAAAGFGEFQPLDRAVTPAARAKNRRIELKLDQR
ncbi:MAG: peptidoglycan -binding protein [Rhodospirillaceae bacterium]|nr:peptidoglycan -binding protein [Rhodospirillaceae bacterium]